ncbi:MAG: hypothetical protein R2825_13465 [Saprospiraceae bacterium]
MKNLIVIFLTIIVIGGCQTEKNDPINCNLYVRYEEEGNKISAEVELEKLEGGKKIPYTPVGGVAFMASNMTLQNLPTGKSRYVYKYEGTLPNDLTLTWNKPNGQQATISTPAKSIGEFDFLQENEHYVLEFKAGKFDTEDKLVLLFTDANNQKLNLDKQVPANSKKINLSEKDLSTLTSGPAKLSLVLTKTQRIELPEIDCITTFSYYSIEKQIQL